MLRVIWTSYIYYIYIHLTILKVTKVSIVRTPFLTRPYSSDMQLLWRKYYVIKLHVHRRYELTSNVVVCIRSYTLFQALIAYRSIWLIIHMLTASSIFFVLNFLTLVLDIYGLMRRILYVICIAPHCNSTVPLVKHCVIIKGPYITFCIYMQCYNLSWHYLRLC